MSPRIALLFAFFVLVQFCEALNTTHLTIYVEPKKEFCFHDNWEPQQRINFTYHVKDGGKGKLDITFVVKDPRNAVLVNDKKVKEKSRLIKTNSGGVHQFCFDNSHSKFNTKIVTFEYFDENDQDEGTVVDVFPEESYEVTAEEIKKLIKKVYAKVRSVIFMQIKSKRQEQWDMYLLQRNFDTVNRISLLQITVMIIAGLVQVLLVKGLLDERSILNRIWRRPPHKSKYGW